MKKISTSLVGKYHKRFVVVRGFDVYWFRDTGEYKDKFSLPAESVTFQTLSDNQKIFTTSKFTFEQDDKDPDF
jgi:hypothetical protein